MIIPLNKTDTYFHNDIWVTASILSATCQVYLTYTYSCKDIHYVILLAKVHVIIDSQLRLRIPIAQHPYPFTLSTVAFTCYLDRH